MSHQAVYDLTFTSAGGGDGGGVSLCEEATEPVIAVQDRVSTFLRVTSQDILKEASGQFPAVFMATITRYF